MKKIITNFIVLIALFINNNATAQTNVSGGIHSNTTWTLANSPFHITGTIVVFPGNKLTIEPGVKVIFDGNYDLEIRGELVANGSSSANIHFCGKMIVVGSDTSYVLWNRIFTEDNNNGRASFSYCVFKDAYSAVVDLLTSNPINNCIFEYNTFGISGINPYMNSPKTTMNNCIFRYNKTGIRDAYKADFNNCKFYNNDVGMYNSSGSITNCEFSYNRNGINISRGNINNSVFTYNQTAIKGINFDGNFGGTGADTIRDCVIRYNDNGIDDSAYSSGTTNAIINNDISYNKIGVKINYCGRLTGTYNPIIKNNKLCYNSVYNAVNLNNIDKNFTDNCFCTNDSADIEDKLYDGYDDFSLGLLTYNIYDSTCNQKQQNVFKKLPVGNKDTGCITFKTCNNYLATAISSHRYKRDQIKTMPNPFSDVLKIETNLELPSTINITDMFGKIIYSFYNDGSLGKVEIATTNWSSGLYIIVVSNRNGTSSNKVIKS